MRNIWNLVQHFGEQSSSHVQQKVWHFCDTGDASAGKTLLSSQSIWAEAHKQKYRVWSSSAFVKWRVPSTDIKRATNGVGGYSRFLPSWLEKKNNSLEEKKAAVSRCVENYYYSAKYITYWLEHSCMFWENFLNLILLTWTLPSYPLILLLSLSSLA